MLLSKENQKFTSYPEMLYSIYDMLIGFPMLQAFLFLLYKY